MKEQQQAYNKGKQKTHRYTKQPSYYKHSTDNYTAHTKLK